MAQKCQFEYKVQAFTPGFLLIECLLALLIATALVLLIYLGQKKIVEGQIGIIKEFRALQQSSAFLHQYLSSFGSVNPKQSGGITLSMSPSTVEIISTEPHVTWLSTKNLPVLPIRLTTSWYNGNKKHERNFYTIALTKGT